ncbi:MAG: Crp/Fnr family transcriptional regulator, partial [Ignavibacteriaceae bacterium]|nr:Crp/Fnr family transcriptional regulator [Ignavibacteriaceae bacterium]
MEQDFEFLKYVPIFSNLEDEQLNKIVRMGAFRSFKKDSIILSENEDGSGLYVIVQGEVKVSRFGDDGREVIFAQLHLSDFFGEMSIMDGFAPSATVSATEDSELFLLKKEDFLNLVKNNHEIVLSMLSEITGRIRAADRKIKALSMLDAEGKIASVIVQLADEIGRIKKGQVEIQKLPFQHDMANMAG